MFKILVAVLLLSSTTFAVNITSFVDSASSTPYGNTNSNVTMLNISIFANNTPFILEALNITTGDTTGNISAVRIVNSSGTVLGINSSTSSSFTTIFVNLSIPVNLTAHANDTLIVIYEMHPLAIIRSSVQANITTPNEFTSNVTINGTYPISSSRVQIQDVHADVNITPTVVDTNVINQTFLYKIIVSGSDNINGTVITVPAEYEITNVTNVTRDGVSCTSGTVTCFTSFDNFLKVININITGAVDSTSGQTIVINFTINTSLNPIGNITFNSTITGSNMTGVLTNQLGNGAQTKHLINITNVEGTKTTALPNGTDYWEFNFTVNITESASGHIQFRMDNWNNSDSQIMQLTNGTHDRASLYLSTNSSNAFNISTFYNHTRGIQIAKTANNIYNIILRMIIPSNTPVSSSWWTTYNILFRATP
jgi:hypothetical protein